VSSSESMPDLYWLTNPWLKLKRSETSTLRELR